MHGFVLHLRGLETVAQPLVDDHHNRLCFNGEIFDEWKISLHENDTMALMNKLHQVDTVDHVLQTMASIHGPWAFVYWQNSTQRLYFGRDYLGRRSLLYHKNSHQLLLSSTGCTNDASNDINASLLELPTTGIYYIDFLHDSLVDLTWTHVPWTNFNEYPLIHPLNTILPNDEKDLLVKDSMPCMADISDSFLQDFNAMITHAVRKRIENLPAFHNTSRLAILFSGGLDCTVLAALAHQCLPIDDPIDLMNVAFENPRSQQKNSFNVPDRLTGLQSLNELQTLYPNRKFNFVEINVSYKEYVEMKPRILQLMHPLNTVMDLSIAIAFWFAAKGQGMCNQAPYTSNAKVLFSGLGADEQLGGYGRHSVQFIKNGWSGLIQELQLDLDRIGQRNLGRDDRIMSDHGKEVRFPYLDKKLMDYLSQLPVMMKTDPRFPKGVGDKRLLRLLARWLGLSHASKEPKRAIQFGSRTAKIEGPCKGQDILETLIER